MTDPEAFSLMPLRTIIIVLIIIPDPRRVWEE
jgi:hypothetical protein